ncbi:hypothetical protein L227DRAFT_311401 [Lentinus tigrinus ALCF2SS1-6]|uniref:Secreted protein n=1 Tax=Lentinus tigrinus ALCF2SS1-6 TaxID=1328759 RepID=A0A5C2RWU6_9APHY|nr:hypothetical protein L227DRAFT_311401 [Lentinus tigrinus ALCF2SS1-6]
MAGFSRIVVFIISSHLHSVVTSSRNRHVNTIELSCIPHHLDDSRYDTRVGLVRGPSLGFISHNSLMSNSVAP